jgi:hypothetical protein
MTVATVRLSLFLFLTSALATLAADSTGKDASVTDLSTGNGAVYKLIDNGDGTMSPQYVFVSGGGSTTQGKDYSIRDLATGNSLIVQLIDNGDGTKSQVVACPDCAGGGGGAVASVFGRTGTVTAQTGDYTAAQVTNAASTAGSYANPAWITSLIWSKITSTPTTLAGYGITDAEKISSEQTVGDANATWTAGKTTMRATAGMSASRVITLPLAAGYPAGKPILFVDKVTGASSAFIRTFAAAGSDTVEGGLSYSPYPGPGTFEFETDGVSAWIAIHDKGSITEFRDPTDPTKVGQVSASNIGTGHTSVAAWPDINGTWTPAQLLVPTAVKTSGYTAAVDDLVPVDTTSGNVTITLPTAPANGSQIGIKQVIRGGTNTVTYACGGSDVLNKTGGATSGTLTLSSAAVVLQYKASGAIWYIIADDMPYGSLLSNTNTWSGGQTFSGHNTEEGVTATGATGTGKQVYDNAPTLTGHPTIEGVTSTGASGSGKSLYQTSPTINGATQDRFKGTAGSYTVTMNGANTASTKTAAGSDICGLITLTMSSTGNISASICTISGFNFASTPTIILVPNNAATWTVQGNTKVCNVSNITTTSFDISGGTAGLVSGTTYTFNWVAVQ